MNEDQILQLTEELSRFSDPGAERIQIVSGDGGVRVAMVRNGVAISLASKNFYASSINLNADGEDFRFSSYRALLSSKFFADLALWASRQRDVLASKFINVHQIPPHGFIEPSNVEVEGFESIEAELLELQKGNSLVGVLLIDGPAGVGKTHLIDYLSFSAANSFSTTGVRLYLHVRSRGKILSNIEDLMASSLQGLRLNVAFDQIPVLVRHGLVVLAIDGFDELGDPEGYGHAWGQMSDLIESVKGKGVIVLAGRETFIGRERLLRSVASLAKGSEVVELMLDEAAPHQAEKWLIDFGVEAAVIESLKDSGLLERGSFALRPFFLSYLARDLREGGAWLENYARQSDVLPIVVNAMVDREVRRFSGEVASALTDVGVRDYVLKFLAELAREMAGDQSESIADSMLAWISEISLPSGVDPRVISLLKARASSMAFLALDDRPGYRRFGHSQFFNYFLSSSVVDSIYESDVPKWLRRGVVGADFLVAFVPFLRVKNASDSARVGEFVMRLLQLLDSRGDSKDGVQLSRNLAALSFSALCLSSAGGKLCIRAPEIQYAYAGSGTFEGEILVDFIHMLDARSCDFDRVDFSKVKIGTAYLDRVTRFGLARPEVMAVREQDEDGVARDYFDPKKVSEILGRASPAEIGIEMQASPALDLLDKMARSRRYWFKPDEDDIFGNFDEQPAWGELKEALERNSMIRVDAGRQASGAKADWFHIKNARSILLRDITNPAVKNLLEELGWMSA